MTKFLFTLLFFVIVFMYDANGQQRHNFSVGPEQVNCDSLEWAEESVENIIKKINETGFRFQQSVKINRLKGFQEAHFYSCNNQDGYMIIRFDDELALYKEIPKELWDGIAESGNPESFYLNHIKDSLAPWKPTAQ